MKQLNRIILTLTLAVDVLIFWSVLSRTGWAASVSLLGIGDNYTNAIQPILKTVAVTVVAVAGTQLIQMAFRSVRKPGPRVAHRSAHPAG